MASESLQAAVDQFLPEPLRELSAVAKLPPIAALSAHGFLSVNLHVATGGAPQVLSKRKQLGVLAFRVTLHRFSSRYAANPSKPTGRAMLGMCAVFAELEREIIRERVHAGLAPARAQGKRLGRPGVGERVERHIRELRAKGHGLHKVAKLAGCGVSAVQRVLAAA